MPKVTHLYAFLVKDTEDDEGLAAYMNVMGWCPMIGTDEKGIEGLKPMAQRMADKLGKQITVCLFSERKEVEVIHPAIVGS